MMWRLRLIPARPAVAHASAHSPPNHLATSFDRPGSYRSASTIKVVAQPNDVASRRRGEKSFS
ncbi:MAG TPA: hypothetical protein VK388_07165 [Pyrinomonadaceae bacterium]|nr:hypothetical protein [Pyrinomonadaceae bacterium]